MSTDAGKHVPIGKRILMGANLKWTLIRIAVLVGIALVVTRWLQPVRVSGVSMEPAFTDQQIVVINRLAYWRSAPARGDVVAVQWAGERVLLLKRIIALPGEQFEMIGGAIRVNGHPLAEPYTQANPVWNIRLQSLATDEYLVIGDNRTMGQGEHEYGAVARKRIVGRAVR